MSSIRRLFFVVFFFTKRVDSALLKGSRVSLSLSPKGVEAEEEEEEEREFPRVPNTLSEALNYLCI
mgnify:CR=1 FL=1|tara:strand:- start:312 stop:509 length:198 start_codon:yes stop_codon:yes gene_type:complete